MSTWVFALIVLLIGVCLAYYIDRMKVRPGSGAGEPRDRSERSKWLYFWFSGRFPNKEEQAADEEQAKREEAAEREEAARLKREAQRRK